MVQWHDQQHRLLGRGEQQQQEEHGEEEEGVQAAVAELQQLQLQAQPFRLLDLPEGTQHQVARLHGPQARLVCRQLRRVYGAHGSGMRVEGLTRPRLLDLLRSCAPTSALASTSALVLGNKVDVMSAACGSVVLSRLCELGPYDDILAALSHSLPGLQALELPRMAYVTEEGLAHLAPLGPFLTSLNAALWSSLRPPPEDPAVLTRLRALTLLQWAAGDDGRARQQCHRVLARLPALRALDLDVQHAMDPAGLTFSASQWLPRLARSAPQLTSLRIRPPLHDWGPKALTSLAASFPHLASFTLQLQDTFRAPHATNAVPLPAAAGAAIAAALAARSGLTSLSLTAHVSCWGLAQWAALDLTALDLILGYHPSQQPLHDRAFAMISTQADLTSLRLLSARPFMQPECDALLPLASSLVRLHAPHAPLAGPLLALAPRLTRLRELGCSVGCAGWGAGQLAALSGLRHLRTLHLAYNHHHGGFLEQVARLTGLEELALASSSPAVRLEPLQPLQCLKRMLLTFRGVGQPLDPGLGAVRALHALRELELDVDAAVLARLHQCLLPLPPSLQSLALGRLPPPQQVYARLGAAARRQGCNIIMRCTDVDVTAPPVLRRAALPSNGLL